MNIKLPPSTYPRFSKQYRTILFSSFEDVSLYFIYIISNFYFNILYNFKYKNNWTPQGKNNSFKMQFNFVVDLQFCFPSINRSWDTRTRLKVSFNISKEDNVFTMQKWSYMFDWKSFYRLMPSTIFMHHVKSANRNF